MPKNSKKNQKLPYRSIKRVFVDKEYFTKSGAIGRLSLISTKMFHKKVIFCRFVERGLNKG